MNQTGSRYSAAITYYRLKYSDPVARIAAIKSHYLAAYEAAEAQGGKTLSSSGADGVSATWLVGLSQDQRLAVLAAVLDYFENGRRANTAQGRIL